MVTRLPAFVSVKSLAQRFQQGALATASLRLLDATFIDKPEKDAFLTKHIPDAQYFDLSQCADDNSFHPFMLPTSEKFSDYVGHLGIGNNHHVVVYENAPAPLPSLVTSPRIWWMFRAFGHDKVSILNGGLREWERLGHPVTSETTKVTATRFKSRLDKKHVVTFEDVMENQKTKKRQLVDSRFSEVFHGHAPEFRKDIEPGHIPGSHNLPFNNIVDEKTGLAKSEEELRNLFGDAGIDLEKPTAALCSMGVTACCLSAAAYVCGKDVPVYVGSWAEYYQRAPLAMMTLGTRAPAA